MKQFLYLAFWFFQARILGKRRPLQTVIFISDKCNLECKHCCVYNNQKPHIKSYEEIRRELEYSYGLGSRFVDFEGGEPFIWRDRGLTINDLIRLAREIGFFSATVTTNAQLPFDECTADSVWVSLDGLGEFHDAIRGKGTFDRLVANIRRSKHKELSVNMVVNSLNYTNVRQTIEFAHQMENIQSISINFHTPFKGTEELALDWETRSQVVDQVIEMKRAGYPIMNSLSGLKLLKRTDFKKYCWVTNFIMSDGTRFDECQGRSEGVCDQCGFGMAGEMYSVMSLTPDTIWAGLKLRVFGK